MRVISFMLTFMKAKFIYLLCFRLKCLNTRFNRKLAWMKSFTNLCETNLSFICLPCFLCIYHIPFKYLDIVFITLIWQTALISLTWPTFLYLLQLRHEVHLQSFCIYTLHLIHNPHCKMESYFSTLTCVTQTRIARWRVISFVFTIFNLSI